MLRDRSFREGREDCDIRLPVALKDNERKPASISQRVVVVAGRNIGRLAVENNKITRAESLVLNAHH